MPEKEQLLQNAFRLGLSSTTCTTACTYVSRLNRGLARPLCCQCRCVSSTKNRRFLAYLTVGKTGPRPSHSQSHQRSNRAWGMTNYSDGTTKGCSGHARRRGSSLLIRPLFLEHQKTRTSECQRETERNQSNHDSFFP